MLAMSVTLAVLAVKLSKASEDLTFTNSQTLGLDSLLIASVLTALASSETPVPRVSSRGRLQCLYHC